MDKLKKTILAHVFSQLVWCYSCTKNSKSSTGELKTQEILKFKSLPVQSFFLAGYVVMVPSKIQGTGHFSGMPGFSYLPFILKPGSS